MLALSGVNLIEVQHQGLPRRLVGAGRKPTPFLCCGELEMGKKK